MSLREWLIAIGTLVIIGIVIDGFRRMRRARKESMAISSGMGADELKNSPLDEDFNPELPNGGARTISRDTLEERGYVKPARSSRMGTPVQKPTRPVTSAAADSRPQLEDSGDAEDYMEDSGFSSHDDGEAAEETGWSATTDDLPEEETVPVLADESEEPVPPTVTTDVEEDTARREPVRRDRDQPLAGANRPEAREVVVINVLARNGQDFQGAALQNLFEACGLEFGDMDIYHRHETQDTNSPVQFSVANAVEPGTFRPEDMQALTTPGISFFMSLPGPSNAMQAFDFMLETAQCVVKNLGGDLKDERRSVMTQQTIEHCRSRIREFERKQRSKRD